MKLTLRHVFVKPTASLDGLVEERLLGLAPRINIEEAKVRLEHSHEESPAFKVAIHVVTPGPDLRSEARDHTIQAAIHKAVGSLETTITERDLKPSRRSQERQGCAGLRTRRSRR